MDRDDTIKAIRAALLKRSGKSWSVTGGKGTAWGWIRIATPPRRCTFEWDGVTPAGGPGQNPSLAERAELGTLLGLGKPAHPQGESIPASSAYYAEYVARAKGETPTVTGTQYWD